MRETFYSLQSQERRETCTRWSTKYWTNMSIYKMKKLKKKKKES